MARLKKSEKWDWLKAVGVDAGLLVAGYVGGIFAGAYLFANAGMVASMWGPFGIAFLADGAAITASVKIDQINPYEQVMQLQTLEADVLNDKKIVKNYDMEKFAERLEAVLDNL